MKNQEYFVHKHRRFHWPDVFSKWASLHLYPVSRPANVSASKGFGLCEFHPKPLILPISVPIADANSGSRHTTTNAQRKIRGRVHGAENPQYMC